MNFPTLLIAKCDRFVKSVRYCVLQSLSKLHLSTCCFVTEQGQSIGGLLCYHLRIHLKQLLSWSFHRPTFSQHYLIHLFLLDNGQRHRSFSSGNGASHLFLRNNIHFAKFFQLHNAFPFTDINISHILRRTE